MKIRFRKTEILNSKKRKNIKGNKFNHVRKGFNIG